MIINNENLVILLNQSIEQHNSNIKFMKKFNEQTRIISKIDEKKKEISDEDLSKLVFFDCKITMDNVSLEELQSVVKELSQILEKMNLISFSLNINHFRTNETVNLDTEFINSLNENIQFIQLSGINLSDKSVDLFSKFNHLETIGLSNCNISDFDIISDLDSKVGVNLEENPVEENMTFHDIVTEIQKRNGKLMLSNGSVYNYISLAIGKNEKQIDVSRFTVDEITHIMKILNEFEFSINIEKMRELREQGYNLRDHIKSSIKLIISSTSEIDTKTLEDNPEIIEIQIIDEQNRNYGVQEEPYTREEFLAIRKEIDKIKRQIQLPEANDPDREKKIFMQVYRILGKKIVYNEYAITDEGQKDERLMTTCRNLYDGLIKGTAVCAGYADILKNVLSEFGIRAEYVFQNNVMNRKEYQNKYGLSDLDLDEYDESGPGHAWNVVTLDGKKYLCDLTADAPLIKIDNYPLRNCCINKDFFQIQHDNLECSYDGEISEISYEEQLRLLGFSEEKVKKYHETNTFLVENLQHTLDEIKRRKEIADCVLDAALDIKASDFDSIEKSFSMEKEERFR